MKTKIFCFVFYKNYIFLKYKILLIAIVPCSNRTFGNVLPYTAALSPMSQYHIPLILHLDLEQWFFFKTITASSVSSTC